MVLSKWSDREKPEFILSQRQICPLCKSIEKWKLHFSFAKIWVLAIFISKGLRDFENSQVVFFLHGECSCLWRIGGRALMIGECVCVCDSWWGLVCTCACVRVSVSRVCLSAWAEWVKICRQENWETWTPKLQDKHWVIDQQKQKRLLWWQLQIEDVKSVWPMTSWSSFWLKIMREQIFFLALGSLCRPFKN